MIPLLLVLAAASPARVDVQLAQLSMREHVVVRVTATPLPAPLTWREHKGPRCIAIAELGGAALTDNDQIDFILRGGTRIRAKLDGACPALTYYHGFYLRPGEDGQVCQDRDAVHARSGAECMIAKFRLLTPKPAR